MNELKEEAKELYKRITKEGWTIGVHTNILALLYKMMKFKE